MLIWAVTIGLWGGLGALAAVLWHGLSRRSETKPLFASLGRCVRALLSDEGDFLREYASLLARVGAFVFWQALALASAVAPILLVSWLFWPYVADKQLVLIAVCSLTSMGMIFRLRSRVRQRGERVERSGLSVSDSQFFLLQVVESAPWLMQRAAAFETRLLKRRLEGIPLDRPVFITGLARSGTTMLLERLAQVDGVATHRYCDFPFLMTPYFWNRFVRRFGTRGEPAERPHQDGIRITPQSPEAFEEPLWQRYFPTAHQLADSHVLDAGHRNEEFDRFFADHLRKLLLIRGGHRYVSKGNYNLTRIEYIASLLPDAWFVVPIRHPVTHVASLVRQHRLFCGYARQDRRVPHYLSSVGHFEFGPQRIPISVRGSGARTWAAWEAGDEHAGYALQWRGVYEYVSDLLDRSPELAERVLVVRYEDFCDDARGEMTRILRHTGLEDEGAPVLDDLGQINRPATYRTDDDATFEAVWRVTEDVAASFGYDRTGRRDANQQRASKN